MTAVDKPMGILAHLEDLRKVIIYSLIALMIATVFCFFYSDQLLEVLKRPISMMNLALHVTAIGEGFFVKINLSLYAGFVLALPVILWQVGRFLVPALYPNEKRFLMLLVPIATLLFVAGVLFSYFTVFPIAIKVLLQIAGELEPIITVSEYVSFAMKFLIPFGLVFELPVIALFLTRLGIITPQLLASKRKYALLIIFIIAAVLTPGPDPLSQILMAVPMYILYEVSILVSRVVKTKKDQKSVEAEQELEAEFIIEDDE